MTLTTPKKAKTAARIADLERKLKEALAGQVHTYHFADQALDSATAKHLSASGAVITITALGGREIVGPTLIRDGLSAELIEALRADLRRSYERATQMKPRPEGSA